MNADREMTGLFENNHAAMLLVDPSGGRIIDANPAAERFYGWSRDELRAMKVTDINTLDAEHVQDQLGRAKSEQRNFFEFTHRLADGTERVVEVRSGPVTVEGEVLLLSIVHDITARTEAQAALGESERRLRKAEEVAGLGHWAAWIDDGRLEASEGAHRIYGRPGGVTLPIVQAMVLDEYRDMMDRALSGLVASGEPYDVEFQIHRETDGAIVDVRSIAEYDAETRVVFGVIQDITAYKRVERELERHQTDLESLVAERTHELEDLNAELVKATAAKSMFLASMSHELRTPLNSIIGFSGMLANGMVGALSDEQRAQVEMIHSSGCRLLGLIDEILDLSRIEAGTVSVELASVDMFEVAAEVVELLRPLASQKGLDVSAHHTDQAGAAHTDRRRVYDILINLVGNAIKFTDSGAVTVSVEPGEVGWIDVVVADTGPGIHADEMPFIFNAFHQAGRADRGPEMGAGLGLSISQEYAHLLGGDISVRSRLGEGARFTLSLPLETS